MDILIQDAYKKCLDIVLKSMRQKLISFLSIQAQEDTSKLAIVTEFSDSQQKEQYKSYGLLLSSCGTRQSKVTSEKTEMVSHVASINLFIIYNYILQ